MKQSIIAIETFSSVILLVMLYGILFETKNRGRKKNVFLCLLMTVFIATISDVLSMAVDSVPDLVILSKILTFFAKTLSLAICAFFVYYMYLHCSEKAEVKFAPFGGMILYCIVTMVIIAAGCVMGYIYTYENGTYQIGKYYYLYLAANVVPLIYGAVMCIVCARYLGLHDCIATVSFILLPTCTLCINVFFPKFSINYAAITVSLLIIYIMLQSAHEKELVEKDMLKSHQLAHDGMTGLLNRRSFDAAVEKLRTSEGTLGVVSCDLNGLKFTNDHFGHETGDKMICYFADILRENFRKNEVFRISGDEFIVLMHQVPYETMQLRISNVKRQQNDFGHPISSLGFDHGKASNVDDLIKSAEGFMYDDKRNFYLKYPAFRR